MASDIPEILAPAGGMEQLVAAVRCGADAVYLGAKDFSARQNAKNFDEKEIEEAIDYCHLHGVKVYAALNTLVSDSELSRAVNEAKFLADCAIDAFIIQDVGLAMEIKKHSSVPLHASTQMSVGTKGGFRLLHELGFKRAVLPRELSFEEIKEIADDSDIETECFIHGALCMSVSGQCYLSAMLGSRSGNRGYCAQPCRLPFGREGGEDRFLSLKDLSLIERLNDLKNAGVTSFKIEGRMKRAEYVAAAVTAARACLSGTLTEDMLQNLKSVFSRSGFTSGHFLGKRDKYMFGIRQKEDVVSAQNVLKDLKKLYEKEIQNVPVDFKITVKSGEPASLLAESKGEKALVIGDKKAEKAINRELDEGTCVSSLKKCGGSAFFANRIECSIEKGLSLPVSEINLLRRRALNQLQEKITSQRKYYFNAWDEPEKKALEKDSEKGKEFFAYFQSLESFSDGVFDLAYLPLSQCASEGFDAGRFKTKIYASLPRMIFGREERVKALAQKAKNNNVSGFLVGGLDGFSCVKDLALHIHANFGMNVFSSATANALKALHFSHLVLSPELTVKQINRMDTDVKKGVFAYGRLPLMITRACPLSNLGSCKDCGKQSLTDRMGVKFPVKCSDGFTEILNSRPIYFADKLDELSGADYILLYFTDETKEEIINIADSYKKGMSPKGEFTRGLLYRGSI